ncbi:MAG: 50S ribosomal protein P1 [Candidatus Lokiarchaeota archaeon]|nr:50S ribosomal protein P1 [Candidatus Lokiarchaeota archaeon]
MEYIYASLILNEIGNEVNEENLEKILTAAGADINSAQIKAVIAALEDVDINEAIKSAAIAAPAAAPAAAEAPKEEKAEKEEEKEKEEEEEKEEVQGLGSLFG